MNDVEVKFLISYIMIWNVVEEEMVVVVGEGNWVVIGGEGGDWVWVVVVFIYCMCYFYYVMEFWVVFKYCYI